MKRAGNLYDKICDPDNLRLAWYKAKRGKEAKYDVYKYGKRIQENLRILRTQLLEGNPEIGNYHFFRIFEPKERIICAASFPEQLCYPAWERAVCCAGESENKSKQVWLVLQTRHPEIF